MWSKPIRLSIHSREGYPMTATSFPTSKAKEPTWKIVSAWKDFSEFTNLYPGERGSLHNVWWTLINAWLPVYHFFTYVACKFEMSHVFASNKTYEYRGGCDHLSVSFWFNWGLDTPVNIFKNGQFYKKKIVDFVEIQTLIVGVVGEHTDHLTSKSNCPCLSWCN